MICRTTAKPGESKKKNSRPICRGHGEVYRAHMQGDRKMRYFENDLKTERFVLGKEGQWCRSSPAAKILWTGWWMKCPAILR